jgi:hypothetical protein
MHRKKRFTSFPSPAGMSLTKLPLGRNNSVMTSLFPPIESFVVTSRLGTGNFRTFFLRCGYRNQQRLSFSLYFKGCGSQQQFSFFLFVSGYGNQQQFGFSLYFKGCGNQQQLSFSLYVNGYRNQQRLSFSLSVIGCGKQQHLSFSLYFKGCGNQQQMSFYNN